jgi:hypothetical protein
MAEMQSGNMAVTALPTLVQRTTGSRYRVTMDKIHSSVVKLKSSISPQHISAMPQGKHGLTSTYTRTAHRVLVETLERIKGLGRVREMMLPMHVLGSAGIRLVLKQYGAGSGFGKEQKGIKEFEIDWANIKPWEILRDPSANSLDMERDESIVGHEKARTLGWMKQHYGWAPESDAVSSTMGNLLSFQDTLASARGMGTLPGTRVQDSKEKAVMVREFWLKDPDKTNEIYAKTGLRVDWPWMFVGWQDPGKGGEFVGVDTIGDKGLLPNPFSTLPIFFFHFDPMIDGMWAAGVPWRLMQGQDITNIAWTWLVTCMQLSAPKTIYQSGTITQPEIALNNDPWEPIAVNRPNQSDIMPSRMPGAQMPSTPEALVGMAPAWMQESVHIADVQKGMGYKRDGSGAAYDTLIKQAESVPEDRVKTNEIELARLLCATITDTINVSNLKQLRALLGPDVPDENIRTIKREDARKHINSVNVHPTTLRPKTVGQTEEHFERLGVAKLLDPASVILETYLQAGTALSTPMKGAFEKQATEIDRMLGGEKDLPPHLNENHAYHIKACELFIDSPRSMDVLQDRLLEIAKHSALHMAVQSQLAIQAQGLEQESQPGQASPPANSAGPEGFAGVGTAEPAGAAAGAA